MSSTLVLWLHLLAATVLIGGVIVMRVVVRPVVDSAGPESPARELMRQMGQRFRTVSWISVITLVLTGSFNLLHAGAAERIETEWGVVLMIKLLLFAIFVGLLLIHDFVIDSYHGTTSVSSTKSAPRSSKTLIRNLLQRAIVATGLLVLFFGASLAAL